MQQWQIGKNTPSIVELEGILKKYPWFAVGHKSLYTQLMAQRQEYSSELIKRAAPYLTRRTCEDGEEGVAEKIP